MALAAPFPAARHMTGGSLRLTRRGRIVLGSGLATAVLAVAVAASGAVSAEADGSAADRGTVTGVVVVQAGDSLWQIAQELAPGVDPRETVTRIRELNALGDAPIVPGQAIVVPLVAQPS